MVKLTLCTIRLLLKDFRHVWSNTEMLKIIVVLGLKVVCYRATNAHHPSSQSERTN